MRDHAPRERQRRQLERKQSRRAVYDRILIVSEGSKTEPLYFADIRTEFRLHTANVAIQPSGLGTGPVQVVNFARDLFAGGDKHKGIQPRAFEQVYAVFDRDDHPGYFDALKLAESLNGKLRNDARQAVAFKAIASVPCFELWLLLHFEDVFTPVHRRAVLRRVRRHLPGYDKGMRDVFAATRGRLHAASLRADGLAARNSAYDDPEPYTGVADLVRLLTGLQG